MNIYLPLITNFIIAVILIAGIFVGRKNGWRLELSKLTLTIGSLIGFYFLNPIIVKKLSGIGFIQTLISTYSLDLVKCLCLTAEFVLVYLILSLIFMVIRKKCRRINTIKPVKINTAKSLKSRKERRRDAKEFKKLNTKQISKSSKVMGSILGLLLALVVGYVVMIPVKHCLIELANSNTELELIVQGYEYTIYGQFDKLTGINIIR